MGKIEAYTASGHTFPTLHHALGHYDGMEPLTLREIFIAEAGNAIRDKPDWWEKFKDNAIWKKWLKELRPLAPEKVVTKAMAQYLRDELGYLAEDRNTEDGIDKGLDMTYKSDKLIPQSLREDLLMAVRPLEDVPEHMKDWHPNSGNQVLDLVHPSLYPVVFGRTYLKSAGGGSLIKVNRPNTDSVATYSEKFQWLPTDFSIDPSTKTVKFENYINNLHPIRHKKLYLVLQKLLSACLPMFDRVLFDMRHPPKQRIKCVTGFGWYRDEDSDGAEVEGQEAREEASDNEEYENEEGVQEGENEEGEDEEGENEGGDNAEMKGQEARDEASDNEDDENEGGVGSDNDDDSWFGNRKLIIPDADEFFPPEKSFRTHIPEPEDPDVEMKDTYYNPKRYMKATLSEFGRGQVIVKLANIELTPENPTYPGGGWHLEGMLNERIAATVIYYYDSENITDNHLAFRQSVWTLEHYEQNDARGFKEIFGLRRDDSAIQNLGYIVTKQDRVIAFPNLYQHKVSPFSLADKTKPGHRKICVFFLVDPGLPIISTSQVGPQQEQWWKEEIYKCDFFQKLPPELADIIFEYVDSMTMEEAKEIRLELMKERGLYVEMQNSETYAREFSLCEH